MPSAATEFRAAVGCWRDRRLHCKARRRHGGVRRSESRQTASPSANARARWGRATTSDSRPAFPDESAALAGEVGATREAWVSCLVGRKANGPSSEDPPSRRETSTHDCHSGEAVSPTRATGPFARPANGPPTTTPATTIGALVRERMPGSHRQPRLNRGCGGWQR